MSGLPARSEDAINGVDVREQGSALRVATNTPHLVSLGTGRLSTAVTLHPIKQGRVTIGSDPTCDIYVLGTGVSNVHCRVENSHGVVTLYPVSGSTMLDGLPVDKPTRLSQGSPKVLLGSVSRLFNGSSSVCVQALTCDIYVLGTGVSNVHCRVENSHGVVTLYPVSGSTMLDGLPVDKPTRLSQGSMLTIGRSNYLRFNHPEEAKLMKSVLPSGHLSMAPLHFQPSDCVPAYANHHSEPTNQCYQNTYMQKVYADTVLSQLDQELDMTLKEMSRKKPPVAPRKPYKDLDQSDSNSDQESRPKVSSIMAKVSKFEYYAKQQKSIGRSQFYTTNENEISPKVFSSNSLTVNTPAKDVLGGKTVPNYMNKTKQDQKVILLNENNSVDPKNCSYANVAIRNKTKIDDIVRNFDDSTRNDHRLPKKVNNDQVKNDHIYGRINAKQESDKNNFETCKNNVDNGKNNIETCKNNVETGKNNVETGKNNVETCKNNVETARSDTEQSRNEAYGRIGDRNVNLTKSLTLPSPAFDRNPQYSPVYANFHNYDRNMEAENKRIKAYQDRVKEEEQKEAETARLEEILNMCAEYERQIASGIPITPTEKRSHNKIITNGSLPRSGALNNPNFVQTSDGYYKFDTSQNRNNSISKSLPIQRNLSSYENFDLSQSPEQTTPEVTIRNQSNYENVGRMDEIGIPVFDDPNELSSPIMIRKYNQSTDRVPNMSSPIGSPYENVYYRNNVYGNLKPKSPNTQSPRTRIKTTFAHKNLPSPQYFIFPTPPPKDNTKIPDFGQRSSPSDSQKSPTQNDVKSNENTPNDHTEVTRRNKCEGIEKQLSLEEEIPMIDDSDVTNDIEFRYSKIITDKDEEIKKDSPKEPEIVLTKNLSFDDVKKELMADIPELEEFEKDLKQNKQEKLMKHITETIKKVDVEADSIDSAVVDDNTDDLKTKYDSLKDERRKLVAEIHEIKCKMTEIRAQEDDILRELEMEKALIKGEYDSEIAILNIEQKKKIELAESAKRIEEEIRQLKEKQEARQNEMRDRVEIATMKVERLEKDMKDNTATLEELQNAQDILDNETKISEDLEFQHLEEESELLANREDIQNEIIVLTKKIEAQKSRILNLKSEANNNLTSALDETKVLRAEYLKLLNRVEELTGKVQNIEKELKPIVAKLNDIERTQSPDSAFYTDQTRTKSGEFGYSPQSSDSDEIDITKISEDHTKQMKDKFNSIDQMSQSMFVEIERRVIGDIDPIDNDNRYSESPSKSSTSSKEKKGFWERNFDSLKRKKKQKTPEKIDIMSQSLNENMLFNTENIETDFDKFNSLRHSKKKEKKDTGPVKSNSSSKIPTFAALGKIMKKDSFGKKSKDHVKNDDVTENNIKNRYVKNPKPILTDNKYIKAKSLSPDKINYTEDLKEETAEEVKEATQNQKGHVTFETMRKASIDNANSAKILHRKSCGDEPSIKTAVDVQRISDSGKIPSQDDIDRISKVTMDAPILSSDTDMNSLGKRTLDSLMEIERKRMEMLEEQGCQVIENEREKISELKRRVQDETKKLWDQKYRSEQARSFDETCQSLPSHYDEFDRTNDRFDRSAVEDSSLIDDSFMSSAIFEESSGLMSSSIEELQVRHSRESAPEDKLSDDSRPLSHASDLSTPNILSLSSAPRRSRRGVAPASDAQRPLTRYLPVDRDDFDLRRHVESAGHQIEVCPYVTVNSTSCRGYLLKLGAKFHTWSKRWFVFDRESKTFVYYWDKSEKKPRGGAYFQVIEEVYLDHGNTSKSPNPLTTFIVKTRQRRYYLMAPSGEAARIWIDVIFTGAQGYTEYLE